MAVPLIPDQLSVEELIGSFAEPAPGPVLVPSKQRLANWEVHVDPTPPLFYVSPHLARLQQPQEAHPFCYLIAAPAAVGKSTLASYLHNRLVQTGRTVLYVPLQKAKIGDRYLAGLLSEAFPTSTREQLFQSLFAGRIVILFDGYDEVSMTTWQIETNKKFTREVVEDMCAFGGTNRPIAPCFVFLYRSVFSETGIFDELGPFATHFRVEFFDKHQRREYLKEYLGSKGTTATKLVPLVDQFLAGFENRADAATPQADAFFGHAIVLSAFGDFLLAQEQENVYKLAQNLEAEGVNEAASVSILRGVIDTILSREVEKFPKLACLQPLVSFQPFDRALQERALEELAITPAGRNGLSEVDHLVDKLGREMLASNSSYSALPDMSQQVIAQEYLENLRKKLELHPFLDIHRDELVFKNPIYQEYYLARYVSNRPGFSFAHLNKSDQAPSYFLALFLLSMVDQRDFGAYPEAAFFLLRLLSVACNGDEYQLLIDYDASQSAWLARVESDNLRVAPFVVGRGEILALQLPANGVFQNFSVDGKSEGLITVRGPEGHGSREPIMLSHGNIAGEEIDFDATAVTFDSVSLTMAELSLNDRLSELKGLETVTLNWKDAPKLRASDYARTRWGRALTTIEDLGDPRVFQGKLKKIFLWFRKHGKESYGVYRPRFYTCATSKKQDTVAMRISDFLFKQGILIDGSLIVLNQSKLAQYDVYYAKQNELRFGAGFDRLFKEWQAFDSER